MKKPRVSMGIIITDACPKGWGAILVKVQDTSPRVLFPVEAVEGMISENEAQLHKVEYGEASSQAVMEALAIVRAVEKWGHKMRERAVLIRSDSSVALSMTKRQCSPHPSLNFLAAELTLRLEKYQVPRITLRHIKGSWNQEADWLSRLHEREGKPKPPGLEGMHLMRAAPWKANNFWLKAPGDTSEGGQTFTPQDNIFDHLARR